MALSACTDNPGCWWSGECSTWWWFCRTV